MRWAPFAIALLAVLALQTSVVALLPLGWVDLFLAFALLCALVGPVHEARLACVVAGFVQGLAGGQALGVQAFALGLAGLVVTRLRTRVNVQVWLGRLAVALAGGFCAALFVELHSRFWEVGRGDSLAWMFFRALGMAAVAALLAAGLTGLPWLMARRRRGFGPRA